MISLIVISIIFISVCSVAGYAIMQASHSVSDLRVFNNESIQVSKRLNILSRKLYPFGDDGSLVSLVGGDDLSMDVDGNYIYHHNLLPSGINLSLINSWGRPVVYCPVSPELIPSGYTDLSFIRTGNKVGDNSGYNVGYKTSFDGQRYVAYSDQVLSETFTDRGVIAVIISPLPSGELAPKCQDVIYDQQLDKYSVNGGIVSVISRNDLSLGLSSSSLIINGSDKSYNRNINNMINQWSSSKSNEFVLRLANGTIPYKLTESFEFNSDRSDSKRRVYIIGDRKKPVSIAADFPLELSANGIDLYLDGVEIDKNISITVSNGSITTNESVLHSLEINESDMNVSGPTSIKPGISEKKSLKSSNSRLKISDSRLSLTTNEDKNIFLSNTELISKNGIIEILADSISIAALELTDGSKWNSRDSVINTHNLSTSRVQETPFIDIIGSSILWSDSIFLSENGGDLLIRTSGKVELNNSKLKLNGQINKAIVLEPGSSIYLNNQSEIGEPEKNLPFGIIDRGAVFLGGTGVNIYSSNCFSGGLLSNSTLGNSSPTNAEADSYYRLLNKSDWHCSMQ